MSHADRFRSSNASISREDWERVFGKEQSCAKRKVFLSKAEERRYREFEKIWNETKRRAVS